MVSVADYGGVWLRKVLYEPRDVVADTSDVSLVVWVQSPCGAFVDLRQVRHEGSPRGFAGYLTVTGGPPPPACSAPSVPVNDAPSSSAAPTLTWHRQADSRPSCCPSGIDSAVGRRVAPNLLLEEGDGYLEVWERLGDASAILSVSRVASAAAHTDAAGGAGQPTAAPSPACASARWADGWLLTMTIDAATTAAIVRCAAAAGGVPSPLPGVDAASCPLDGTLRVESTAASSAALRFSMMARLDAGGQERAWTVMDVVTSKSSVV
jgi:hypothetical protein